MSNEWSVPEPPRCLACGVRHMPETLMVPCLEAEIRRLRAELEPWRRLRAEVARLPESNVGKRGR